MKKLLAGVFLGGALVCAFFSSDIAGRDVIRDRIVALDALLFDGWVWRLYQGQRFPELPQSLPERDDGAYSWIKESRFLAIGHRLGPALHGGQNTLRTLEEGLRMGFKVFEVDLVLTVDGHLICYPGPTDENEDIERLTYLSYIEAMKKKGTETCRFTDLVEITRRRPDVKFVIDLKSHYGTKDGFERVYRVLRQDIGDHQLNRSFIPQLYDFEQIETVRKEPVFAGEIFTSYQSALTTQQIFELARRTGIKAVALNLKRFKALKAPVPQDLAILVHPVNDPYEAEFFRALGVRGIYTSYLTAETVPELFSP